MERNQLIDIIVKAIAENIGETPDIPVGISNRHVHLSRHDMGVLFGVGSELTVKKDLIQPGQYAAEETVTLVGNNGKFIDRVRVLGPLRSESQVEVSMTDSFQLGIDAPIKESGNLDGTAGILLKGPKGSVKLSKGVIVAWRHVHLSIEKAKFLGINDQDIVTVESDGKRGCILKNVLARVSNKYAPEFHIDLDEANACGLKNNDRINIRKDK